MALPHADLRERIFEELEKNPALEVVSDPLDSAEATGMTSFDQSSPGSVSPANSADSSSDDALSFLGADDIAGMMGAESPLDSRLLGTGSLSRDTGASSRSSAEGEAESDDHQDFIEGSLHREETLQEHLLEGLVEIDLSPPVRALAEIVIQNLDKDGFHIVPPAELTGSAAETLEAALDAVRSLDPAGCATCDFHESLIVQARLIERARGRDHPDRALSHAIEILERHFETLEKGRPDALVKALAKKGDASFVPDLDEAEEIFDIIRSLDPFPGRIYGSEPVSCIIPDVIVKRTEDDYSVIINDEEIPVLGVAPFFMELDSDGSAARDAEARKARDFVRESVKEARWFIGTIERRNLTILKLARALVVFQRDFFTHGPAHLAPLRMKDIAEEIGMHEATVSRAANGKYLQCEWGVFELRYFFSNEIGSGRPHSALQAGGQASAGLHSKQGVKEIIREIITDSRENLSDQKIADLLAQRGIKIARRTVAKYRGELTIGSSLDRQP
jgi:RNA polymerase sigma-54 factor